MWGLGGFFDERVGDSGGNAAFRHSGREDSGGSSTDRRWQDHGPTDSYTYRRGKIEGHSSSDSPRPGRSLWKLNLGRGHAGDCAAAICHKSNTAITENRGRAALAGLFTRIRCEQKSKITSHGFTRSFTDTVSRLNPCRSASIHS